MDAANPLCRCFLLAAALFAVIGCQTEEASRIAPITRGQMPPADPLAPIAPPLTPPVSSSPSGPVMPAVVGAPVVGTPVPADAKGAVVRTGFTTGKTIGSSVDLLRAAVPRVRIVARVGETNVITDQEVIEAVYQQYHQLAGLDERTRTTKQKEMYTLVLRKTIERELILDDMYAKLKKANKPQVIEEIKEFASSSADRQLRMFRADSGAKSDEEFAAMLRVQGLTIPVIRRQMERQLMAEQYISSALKEKSRRVGLGEVRDYYDKHAAEFQSPDRVKWLHLFVAIKNHPTPQAAYNHAAALGQKAAGGADFAALAMQFDEGLAKQQKGFGTGEKRGEVLPADVEPTVWELKPGQTSGVIQTPTGFHIVKVAERDYAGTQPFDTAVQTKIRDRLNKQHSEAEYRKLVEELWRKGVVSVFEE